MKQLLSNELSQKLFFLPAFISIEIVKGKIKQNDIYIEILTSVYYPKNEHEEQLIKEIINNIRQTMLN